MDRPSLSPFDLLDQIEREFGMRMAPVLWPIGDGDQFKASYIPNVFVLTGTLATEGSRGQKAHNWLALRCTPGVECYNVVLSNAA